MDIVFITPPSKIKGVVSTTSAFQRTKADILKLFGTRQLIFTLFEQLTAEDGLDWTLFSNAATQGYSHFPNLSKSKSFPVIYP
jgi:hypothetical protein